MFVFFIIEHIAFTHPAKKKTTEYLMNPMIEKFDFLELRRFVEPKLVLN